MSAAACQKTYLGGTIVLSVDKLDEQRRWEKLETECSLVNIHVRFVGMLVKASPFTLLAVN